MITAISVIGITFITAALVVLLSAFNGIESMVEKLYSEFDSDVVIRSVQGKTFNENQIDFEQLKKIPGINNVSRAVEEVVVLKNEKKWVNAHMVGIDPNFLAMSKIDQHMVDGFPILNENNEDIAIIGASLLDNLGGYIPTNDYETLTFYAPKRNAKVRLGSNPFTTRIVKLSGRMNFNREVNAEYVLVPLTLARELLDYEKDVTAIYVEVAEGYDNETVKESIIQFLSKGFEVKTNYEKNELIYKTSKTEKIIVIFILLFIFILATFNLVASLTMLFIEKMDNIKTMISFGADRSLISRIFFYEGLLISFTGIIFGLFMGYSICLGQINGKLLEMPNSGGEAFPMRISMIDGVLIIGLVSGLSILASYLPVKFLLKRNFSKEI